MSTKIVKGMWVRKVFLFGAGYVSDVSDTQDVTSENKTKLGCNIATHKKGYGKISVAQL